MDTYDNNMYGKFKIFSLEYLSILYLFGVINVDALVYKKIGHS